MQDNENPLRLAIQYSEGILSIIDPWIRLIVKNKKEYPHFNKLVQYLPIHNLLIQKFILFSLLPFFYEAKTEDEERFLRILKKINPLDLERYVEECEILYLTCV